VDDCHCGRKSIAKGKCTTHYRRPPQPECIVDGCDRESSRRKLCEAHYRRLMKHGDVGPTDIREWDAERTCSIDGCDADYLASGLCVSHYMHQPEQLFRARNNTHNRRVRVLDLAPVYPIPTEKVQARIDYYGGLCYLCGAPADTIDHVKPISKGGAHIPANLRPACLSCNSSKRDTWKEVETTYGIK